MIRIKASYETEDEKQIVTDILGLKNYIQVKSLKGKPKKEKSLYKKTYINLIKK